MHELDINTAADGTQVTSFATARKPAWHRLGTVFASEMSVAEALEAAHLARWNVRKLDMFGREDVVEMNDTGVNSFTREVASPAHKLVVRDNPVTGAVEPFGPIGSDFAILQNEQHGEFLEALLDMSGAQFLSTAGAIKGGRQVFYCAKLPEVMNIGGVDRHDLYVTALNGHDGSMAIRVIASPVRVVCANTQAAAIASAAQTWSRRHTKNAHASIEDARKGLDMTFKFNEAFEAAANRMIDEQLSKDEFDQIIARVFDDKDPNKETSRKAMNRHARNGALEKLWVSDTQANIAGTRWAGYNVITEWVDHFSTARGAANDARDSDKGERQGRGRAINALTGWGSALKADAFAAFAVPA